MKISLYLDEDSQDNDLVQSLRLREIDVLTSSEAGMNGREDREQLEFASSRGRVLYSYNSKDFFKLHTDFLSRGETHAGLVLAPQQEFSIGEQTRRLLKMIGLRSAEEMRDRVEFMGKWK